MKIQRLFLVSKLTFLWHETVWFEFQGKSINFFDRLKFHKINAKWIINISWMLNYFLISEASGLSKLECFDKCGHMTSCLTFTHDPSDNNKCRLHSLDTSTCFLPSYHLVNGHLGAVTYNIGNIVKFMQLIISFNQLFAYTVFDWIWSIRSRSKHLGFCETGVSQARSIWVCYIICTISKEKKTLNAIGNAFVHQYIF